MCASEGVRARSVSSQSVYSKLCPVGVEIRMHPKGRVIAVGGVLHSGLESPGDKSQED
jgi:hypothetical protein